MRVGELRAVFQDALKGLFPSEEIESFFYLLSEAWLGYSRLELALKSDTVIPSEVERKIQLAIRRLQKEEPIQYILGNTEFYGLVFKVTSDTLIPRPETEELVDWIVKDHPNSSRVLDIGTGSGCIAISLGKHLEKAQLTGLDISEETLKVARRNAVLNETDVDLLQLDVLQADSLPGTYDIIVSNPPYVRVMEKAQMKNNVLKYEPEAALFVPDEDALLFYRKIVALSVEALKNDGWLFFEINEYLGESMFSLLKSAGFENVELKRDFRGKDRFIRGQYLKDE